MIISLAWLVKICLVWLTKRLPWSNWYGHILGMTNDIILGQTGKNIFGLNDNNFFGFTDKWFPSYDLQKITIRKLLCLFKLKQVISWFLKVGDGEVGLLSRFSPNPICKILLLISKLFFNCRHCSNVHPSSFPCPLLSPSGTVSWSLTMWCLKVGQLSDVLLQHEHWYMSITLQAVKK